MTRRCVLIGLWVVLAAALYVVLTLWVEANYRAWHRCCPTETETARP